jgi:hypothetical protein
MSFGDDKSPPKIHKAHKRNNLLSSEFIPRAREKNNNQWPHLIFWDLSIDSGIICMTTPQWVQRQIISTITFGALRIIRASYTSSIADVVKMNNFLGKTPYMKFVSAT